jgi:hypothetical protein
LITYQMDGPMLIVTKSGRSTLAEREALFDALRADPAVPDGALLLLDLRHDEDSLRQDSELESRVLDLQRALGRKLGPACAMIVHEDYDADARSFQEMPAADGYRLVMFTVEAAARRWLSAFAPPTL